MVNPNGANEDAFWAGLNSAEVYPDWGTPPADWQQPCNCGSHPLAPLYHRPECPKATLEQRKEKILMNRKIVVLTPAQCELIASALEVINPDDAEMEKQARALAIQFRSELD